ncbi:four-carbon acid sugar kinase family protein [Edaphobacter sp.]|uniref:four-carbon acid sugar kinase family protein n=1 Tax=Edaphobacter sp. TaxID=1934404 RepID=UPI002DB89DA2|nr:four-carbon acid sugar kinase family protein [Edaphobacter sp.]HEU5340441.1 four-carbon acid sugar kinase family protein [Edaphobacter sp.]
MLYTFYGDDFTGSTDVLEQLASNGVPSVLFLAEPTPEQRERFADVEAIGIAGDSRSRSPQWMTENLPRIFATLRSFRASVNHYKVCSTFDSSSTHGSIGRALELGRGVFHPTFVPIVVAAPHLGRYVVNGSLFAAAPDGQIKRIDQHPMANHPVTPMREPDLRKHLAAQTITPIGLAAHHTETELNLQLQSGAEAILFDGADEQALAATGELLWRYAQRNSLFAVGSSGLTAALIPAWRNAALIANRQPVPAQSQNSGPLLVLSGSCSLVTAGQIRWALDNGFYGIAIDPTRLLNSAAELNRIQIAATDSLIAGKSVILYTALGSPDASAHGDTLGQALGRLLRHLLETTNTRRAVLCGGDTASHAIQQLGIYALTWAAPVQTGAPLCRAHSDQPALHGIELVLKGGQVGTLDFLHAAHRA